MSGVDGVFRCLSNEVLDRFADQALHLALHGFLPARVEELCVVLGVDPDVYSESV